ncbi:MAG: hypothetical protein Q9M36_02220 [Sulfurovum sp.]|nr:hypothetical protein [Sulfurovum sp.]
MKVIITMILLLMLSFNILHDTLIHIISDETQSIQQPYIGESILSPHLSDMHEIHNIFHFIAILRIVTQSILPLDRSMRNILPRVRYSPPLRERSDKPPIS